MSNDWEIARGTGRCAISGHDFIEGESYYAALLEGPAGLERRDYALDAWTGPPEGAVCYWRARVPVRDKKPAAIDTELLTHLFLRLEDEPSETSQQFRFVLGLLLMRKKLLRFEQTVRDTEREYWQMRLLSDQSLHQVLNPRLTGEHVDRLSQQLLAILSGQVDAIESVTQEPSSAPPPEPAATPPADAPAASESEDQHADA